ncbi:MAG: DUF3857 domain-containing protein [Acidobacteriaceae bacterium]
MKASLLYFFLLPVFFASAFGQGTTPAVWRTPPLADASASATNGSTLATKQTVSDYSAEPAVILHRESVYAMKADGTGSRQASMAIRVQSEAAVKQLGVLIVPYASNSEHVEISYARIRRPDGTVIETPVSEAIDMPNPVTTAAPSYSDLKQMELPIRSLSVGDTLEWQAEVVRTKAEAPGEFWGQENFDEGIVDLSESLELRVPKNMYVNVWSPTNKPTETVIGDERVFHWAASQEKPTVGKAADAEKERKKNQVWTAAEELDAKKGKVPSVAWTTFKSWEAVGAWYRGLEDDRSVPDATVQAKVAELAANKGAQEEKVRAIYGYVAEHIHYIGVAFGVGKYQPHQAFTVLQNQYGDCKDKATLLAAMLNVLGLHADSVLIGAGVRFNPDVPSPASFNHLITRVSVDGKEVWLDSTAEMAPYRFLMYPIRDQRALAIPQAGVASIQRTPAALPFPSFQTMDAVGTLDKDGISNSRLVLTLRGDTELLLRTAFRQSSPAQYDDLAQRISQSIGYGGTTSHAELSKLEDTTVPLQIGYDYKREKAGDWDHYRIIPQVAPVSLPMVNDMDPPVRAIALGIPRVETSTSAMKLPSGWGVVLPQAVHATSAYATYDETYKFDNGTVYAKRRVEVLKETVPVADWKSYKKWTDAVSLGNEQYIQLTNTGDAASAGKSSEKIPLPAAASNAEAAKLVYSAYMAAQQHDLDTAGSMLDQAKSLNAEQQGLWAAYGYLAAVQMQFQEAAGNFQKELTLHPDSMQVYAVLAAMYMHMGQPDNAKATLVKWTVVDATDPLPYTRLIALLLQQGKATEAAAAGETALAKLPDQGKQDENLQLLIGKAQITAGMKEKGRATLVALLNTTQHPGMMNDSSYELADAGLELPLAESRTRAALTSMDSESKAWTLDANSSALLAKSRLTVATWDTLGWVLFREGKVDEAGSFLKAAWRNAPSPTIAEHLGELEEAKGEKNAALGTYELGLASVRHFVGMGAQPPKTNPIETKLRERADALRKKGAKTPVGNPTQVLQNLRTFSLGAANGMSGSAQYWLLLTDGKVGSTKTIGTERLQGGLERMTKINLAEYWPAGSHANLVRKGILFCGANGCQLVLEP